MSIKVFAKINACSTYIYLNIGISTKALFKCFFQNRPIKYVHLFPLR